MGGETIPTSRKKDTTKDLRERALDGVTVLEYCSMVSGPYCTKIMADLGAGVIKIEPPVDGDPARRMPPYPGGKSHPEKSGLFFYLNTNKRGITLDPETPEGKKIFLELVKTADILVEDSPPGHMDWMGLGYKDLSTVNKGLIVMSITPFGLTGPYRDYKGRALNMSHASGQAYLLPLVSPHSDRPPVKAGGQTSDYDPGLVAVVAVLAALYRKGLTGRGQHIDMSKQEALISMQRVESVTYANDQVVMARTGNKARMPGGVLPCKDGHIVVITPEEHQWNALMTLMGNPEWSKEPWCGDLVNRIRHADTINKRLIAWTTRHTKEEIFRKGQALSCPVSPCQSAEDLINSEQLKTRGFFADVNHPILGPLKMPTSASRFSESPWLFERPAPLLGESNEEIYCERLGYRKEELEILKSKGVI
jgi:crotonobetainyl-CoA:carnitine CoA-transferase CaiB-like acyl-CoA transferase